MNALSLLAIQLRGDSRGQLSTALTARPAIFLQASVDFADPDGPSSESTSRRL